MHFASLRLRLTLAISAPLLRQWRDLTQAMAMQQLKTILSDYLYADHTCEEAEHNEGSCACFMRMLVSPHRVVTADIKTKLVEDTQQPVHSTSTSSSPSSL